MPCIHVTTFRKELAHLIHLGILKPQQKASGQVPPLLYPKKMAKSVGSVIYSKKSKMKKQKQYPFPVIMNILCKCMDIRPVAYYSTKLNNAQQKYTFHLYHTYETQCP
jgi:hypothetical protein